jgi:hypothetical protein
MTIASKSVCDVEGEDRSWVIAPVMVTFLIGPL